MKSDNMLTGLEGYTHREDDKEYFIPVQKALQLSEQDKRIINLNLMLDKRVDESHSAIKEGYLELIDSESKQEFLRYWDSSIGKLIEDKKHSLFVKVFHDANTSQFDGNIKAYMEMNNNLPIELAKEIHAQIQKDIGAGVLTSNNIESTIMKYISPN